jgi:DNA-binding CsgD family transcriptional regulator
MQLAIQDIELKRPLSGDLSTLMHASDWDDLRERTRILLAPFAFADFMLKMDIASLNGTPHCHVFGTLPPALLGMFGSDKMNDADPINRHLTKSSLPLSWQVNQLCGLNAGPAYSELKGCGIEQGFSLAAYAENVVSRVDFYAKTSENLSLSTNYIADLQLIGLHLKEAARLLWQKTAPSQARLLSPRELECLHWSASGKTSQEIGQILGISQHTVYFHLKNVATKLNVYGTRHAISRAITMGIIKSKI